MSHYITPLFNTSLKIPLFSSSVAAGFASPADDHLEAELDLNEYLIAHPSETFFVRAKGDSMQQAGIFDKDLLIVDRSLTPKDNDIVIAAVAGQLTVKRLVVKLGKPWLYPANPNYKPIPIKEGSELHVWGVVVHAIHKVSNLS
ncbi:MAG: translesion error-prone DNA polymerase V autoproteolytic subunit [Methylococcaceae bacterium]|nr:translesion error-prone DNA polymerase V autoproteolytic subunit [Methylococcaceae bacterium]